MTAKTPHYEIFLGTSAVVKQFAHNFPDVDIPLTQTLEYAQWQIDSGRSIVWVSISRDGVFCGYSLIIKYIIPKTYFHYWYAPYGPILVLPNSLDINNAQTTCLEIRELTLGLRNVITQFENSRNNVLNGGVSRRVNTCLLFVRTDTTFSKIDFGLSQNIKTFLPRYLISGSHFQPRAEWQLSLVESETIMLSTMHHKTRYSIKLAERKLTQGILSYEIVEGSDMFSHQKNFEALMKETSVRDKFCMHDHTYYESIFKTVMCKGGGFMINVYMGTDGCKKLLVSNLIVYTDTTAYYLFGTSSSEGRNHMPAYLAQWKAIQKSKKDGKLWYNFGGISTTEYPKRGWNGITDFKVKFGGVARLHPFMCDAPVSNVYYACYKLFKMLVYLKSYVRFDKN